MLSEMRPSELGTWAALFGVDPWDEGRADLRAGIIASTIANVHRGKNTEPYAPIDFMPMAERPKKSIAQTLRDFLKSKPTKKAN